MPHVTPVPDPGALAGASSTLFACAAVVVEQALAALDSKRRAAVYATLADGGWLAVEAAIDAVGATRAVLTCISADGMRHEVASVFAADRTQRAR